jgi:hypothetical protein
VSGDGALRDKVMTWAWPRRDVALSVAVWIAPGLALAVGVQALRKGSVTEIGSLGLISALHPGLYAALALLTASFLICVFRTRPYPSVLPAAHVVVFAILLFGAATIIEPEPRIISGWLHVGFADYIARTGETLPELDARFSWPGLFALTAMATRAAGMKDAMPLLGWTPVVANVLYCAVVFRLARATSLDHRRAWLATWFFLPANWVGQDYFGPQALNYFFYLLIVAALLTWFRPARTDVSPESPNFPTRVCRRLGRIVGLTRAPFLRELEPCPVDRLTLVGLIVTLLVIFLASTASHQLTPVMIVLSVAGLVVVRRCSVRALPILLGVVVLAYISYLTVPYWSGHLHDMFGSFGNVSGTVQNGAVDRVRGDDGHQIVVKLRLLLAPTIWILAVAGAWRWMRRGGADLGLMALASTPFLLLALQSYGGEVFMRVYLFALPFIAVLVATLVAPTWPVRRRAVTAVAAALLSVILTGAFFVARYGNESFEQVRPADVQAVGWLYAHAPAGSSLVAITSNVPWRSQGVERYQFRPLGNDLGPTAVPAIEAEMRRNPDGAYLILTEGQFVYAESYLGEPPGWGENIEHQVIASGEFRLVYANQEARIYVLVGSNGADGDIHP